MRQKLKDQDMFWLEKVKISEVSEFSILPYTQNRKLGNLGKCSFTSNFDSSCNLRFRNDKNELRQKLKGQDMLLEEKKKISEISEFSILSYTQNQKFGNLGKYSFTSNFDSICNFFRIWIFCKQSEALFFLWLLILSHIFPENLIKVPHVVQKIFRFSRSILIFSSIFWVFWHFVVNEEVAVNK